MRIVLDTNVVVSGLLWRGTPYRLFQVLRSQQHTQLFSSAVLIAELGEVLARSLPQRRIAILGLSTHEVLADYIDAVELVTPAAIPAAVPGDPDDDQVVAAAVSADAELIVSGDRDLLDIGIYQGMRILTPAEVIPLITPAAR